jgi:hypothetical protein
MWSIYAKVLLPVRGFGGWSDRLVEPMGGYWHATHEYEP